MGKITKKRYTKSMHSKGWLVGALVILVAAGGAIGFLRFREGLIPSLAPTPTETPIPQKEISCTQNDDCSWFTKSIEINSGQPNEQLEMNVICAGSGYLASCGPDCERRGNIHPSDHKSECVCRAGNCESDL